MFPTFWVTVSSFGGLFFSVWIQGSNIRLAQTEPAVELWKLLVGRGRVCWGGGGDKEHVIGQT